MSKRSLPLPPGMTSADASTPAGFVIVNVRRVFPDATQFELNCAWEAPMGSPAGWAESAAARLTSSSTVGNAVTAVSALREARRAIRAGEEGASRELRCFAVAAEAGILVIMVNALTLNSEIFKILWMLFGLAMSLGHMAQRVIKEQEVRAGLNPVRVTP